MSSAYGDTFAGIYAVTDGDSEITIVNTGSITAESLLAIDTEGGATEIVNEGLIIGRVDLTEEDDSLRQLRHLRGAGGERLRRR